jgi:hypothetical protein
VIDFSFLERPTKELLKVAIADLCRLRSEPLDLVDHVGLEVLSGESPDISRHPLLGEELSKSTNGARVAPDRLRRLVGGPKKSLQTDHERFDVFAYDLFGDGH